MVPVDGEVLGAYPEVAVVNADVASVGPAERDAVLLDVFVNADPSCRRSDTSPRLFHLVFLSLLLLHSRALAVPFFFFLLPIFKFCGGKFFFFFLFFLDCKKFEQAFIREFWTFFTRSMTSS